MDQSIEPSVLAVLLLFILRLGIPLALSLLLAWGLHRLDKYWQSKPGRPQAIPGQPSGATEARATDVPPGLVDRPCWAYRGCPESKRKSCPAGCGTDVLCWLARLRHDGRLPAACRTCPIFTPTSPLRTAQGAVH